MQLGVSESNRWCSAEHDEKPTPTKLRRQILARRNVQSGFSILTAPAPAHDDTAFKVLGNDREILVGIALFDSVPGRSAGSEGKARDEVEIVFDPMNDRIGWYQFYFGVAYKSGPDRSDPHRDRESRDQVQVSSHLPYPEAHSSACFRIELRRHRWHREAFTPCAITPLLCRWLFAWFRTDEVFRNGRACGFNVCRNRPHLAEFSSWNYCSGNGSQDARSLGRLYLGRPPAHVSAVRADLKGNRLHLGGRAAGGRPDLKLVDSEGHAQPVPVAAEKGRWRGAVEIDRRLAGRYRLCPGRGEPDYVAIDVPSGAAARAFCLSVTYDPPMSIIAGPYTPGRLAHEMETWADLGVRRIHWIEYGDWPSFWHRTGHGWETNYARTQQDCGNLCACAARAAHDRGLEFIGDLKTFDLGINCFFADNDRDSTVEDIERRRVSVIPEIAAHQEWTMQSDPAWRTETAFPVTRLRIYSESPIPDLHPTDVRLLTSRDNARFAPYRGDLRVEQGTLRRPNLRWTPAGTAKGRGARKNWYVDLSGLRVNAPFLSVRLGREDVVLRQRGYMVAEAWGASGEPAALTMATNGSSKTGFFFWKGWQGWNNQTEALLVLREWRGSDLGMVFDEMPNMPTLLEPAWEGTRRLWLDRIRAILDCGADGVSIRTYCHHNGPMHYLKYAFAQPVREAFMDLYGRTPEATPEDYERIRRIRGDFYTEFLREGKKLVAGLGRKFIIQLESGAEVPAQYDCRMQMPMDWRTWIEEGIADEIHLKWFTRDSTFVHEQVMPLARSRGVPVHVISRCLHDGIGIRAHEMAELVVGGACAAGLAGYNFYEQQNLMDVNPEGLAVLKGPVRAYFDRARLVLRDMGE